MSTCRSPPARVPRRSPDRRPAGRSCCVAEPENPLGYKLTIRHGPRVERESFDELDQAVNALEAAADTVRAQGRLATVSMLRDFGPSERVAARLEISLGGTFRGSSAGVDVMGDGSVVAFKGGVGRRPLEPHAGDSPFEAVRRELSG